jgi:hypothetical protein
VAFAKNLAVFQKKKNENTKKESQENFENKEKNLLVYYYCT